MTGLILTCSLVVASFGVGCAGIPKPVGKIGVLHTGLDISRPYIHEFDFQTDFDDNGDVKHGAKGTKRFLESLSSLDNGAWMSDESTASVMATKKKILDRLKQCEAGR